jgi:hypothetical protein
VNTSPKARKWMLIAGLLLGFVAVVGILSVQLSPYIRAWAVKALRERYESDVSIQRLEVLSIFPVVRVNGTGLMLRYRGRKDIPPLVFIQRFAVEGRLLGFFRSPRRFRKLEVEGLAINVSHAQDQKQAGSWKEPKRNKRSVYPFVIEEVIADGTVLRVFPRQVDKPHHTFHIQKLRLHSAGIGQAMLFNAKLTNPTPPGLIDSIGQFGPWQADDPGKTPVAGNYTFKKADLSVFPGISGILTSEGKYKGVLERIEVNGQTDTPDFTLKSSGNPVHLKADFSAIVDGTDGDTLLQPVTAHFLRTTLVCRGGVVGRAGVPGKTVSLDVTTTGARLEDLIHLSAKGKQPPLIGDVNLHTGLVIPPGKQDIERKMGLDGEFQVREARFSSIEIQQKLGTLSRRGRGITGAHGNENVASNFKARFKLKSGIMTFSKLNFSVPGASIRLDGSYGLNSERLDFHGALELQAKVSQTTTGVKSFLLRAIDPLFRRGQTGTVLPLNVTGTREHPSFKVDIRRALFRR